MNLSTGIIQSDYKIEYDPRLALEHEFKIERITRERCQILERCKHDLEFREICKARAAKDIIWFINYWVVTYNPRVKPSTLPLILFPRQEECILWILDRYDKGEFATIPKARYTGASWVALCVLAHKLLFEPDFKGSLASNKEESVDRLGDPDSLFEKLVFLIEKLPPWMHFIDLKNDRKKRLISHPAMNSAITGQSGKEIGRSGRSGLVFVDEYGYVEFDEKALAALSENTDCAIFISTPNGIDNQFYFLTINPHIPSFFYPWQADPRRTQEWRDEQTRRFGRMITRQELDIDFSANVDGTLIEMEWVKACVNSHLEIPGLVEVDREAQAGFDIAAKGDNETVITLRRGCVVEEVKVIDNEYPGDSVIEVNAWMQENAVDCICFDGDGIGIWIAQTFEQLDPKPEYSVIEFHGGASASDREWEGLEKTSKDLYANARAEAWGILRWRIQNTYEHMMSIKEHPLTDLISIPNDPQLILDLTKVTYKKRGAKILLDPKSQISGGSPDRGDSLAYCFYDQGWKNWLEFF